MANPRSARFAGPIAVLVLAATLAACEPGNPGASSPSATPPVSPTGVIAPPPLPCDVVTPDMFATHLAVNFPAGQQVSATTCSYALADSRVTSSVQVFADASASLPESMFSVEVFDSAVDLGGGVIPEIDRGYYVVTEGSVEYVVVIGSTGVYVTVFGGGPFTGDQVAALVVATVSNL